LGWGVACAVLAAGGAWAAPSARDPQTETQTKIAAPFSVAAVGDIIMPQPLDRSDPGFEALVAKVRVSDVGFANMESSLVDFRSFEGPVGGTEAPLEVGQAIKAMGINLMNHANNHTLDGGVAGMVSTDRALDALGIVHAGTGPNLQEARAARYLETSKGRVGLVGMYAMEDVGAFGPTYSRTEATSLNGRLGGAAGINPLHLTTYHVVSPDQLESLKDAARAIYGERKGATGTSATGAKRFRFFDEWYEAGPNPGALHYDIDPRDEREILQSIRSGKVYSDFLVATIHTHQTPNFCGRCAFDTAGSGMKEGVDHETPDFLVKLAHEAVDAGADMFVAHGVHTLRGVEIYKGKPIFYGLSNFVFQFGLQLGASYDTQANYAKMAALEDPATQEAVLTVSRFEGGRLSEVRLYPVDLGGSRRPISQVGVPMTPSPAEAARILKALQDYSRPFGTVIAIDDSAGVIRVAESAPSLNSAPVSRRGASNADRRSPR
jgi:poly-gamma-glutamate synthesis protein (capsule biosynthesis protein)